MSWLKQEALLSIKNLLIACLHQELKQFKSEIFHFFGHKRDAGMGLQWPIHQIQFSNTIFFHCILFP